MFVIVFFFYKMISSEGLIPSPLLLPTLVQFCPHITFYKLDSLYVLYSKNEAVCRDNYGSVHFY